MKVIGITGGSGSGKTEVLKILKDKFNAHIIIADEVSRHLSQKGQVSYQLIVENFGREMLDANDNIDRKRLADYVFGNKERLEKLNQMTHPYVRLAIIDEIKQVQKENKASCIIIEAALLIEAGYRTLCDEFWFVYTDVAIRRQRMKETRNYSDAKIDAILKSQLSDNEFRDNCDRTIINNTTLEDVEAQLKKIFQQL